ncbi:hypothetical protein Lepil_0714 [Leptonema illini DSM 21528]|uniref:Uncharacterized protein n=1 Tax=Leptonema illini DSM 21528 TaxID=929563 RepID=H2CDB2_9LEPT|nr:hypothetical protein Lepil_0714 [Leptonema illini DSM 21528]
MSALTRRIRVLVRFAYLSLCVWAVLLAASLIILEGAGRAVNYVVVACVLAVPTIVGWVFSALSKRRL